MGTLVGLSRVLLRWRAKKAVLWEMWQLEWVSGTLAAGLVLGRLNAKELERHDRLQLSRLKREEKLQVYSENARLWTNSQYWH